jgi:hypothetical protein
VPDGPSPPTQTKTALLGYCVPAMEALDNLGRPFVAVIPPAFAPYMVEHDIPHVAWDFDRVNEQSTDLAKTLGDMGVDLAVPLFEETVEWAGALNGHFRDDPHLFTKYLLFRDKAMMKRRAQMYGIRVGVFEEAERKEDVHRFLKRVNKALTKIDGEAGVPIHLKPLASAGCVGHRVIRTEEDVDRLTRADFPSLLETHLDGQEFSCEVFVHDGKIRFLNITEYVHLGYSNFVPASPNLNASRKLIERAVMDLIEGFDIHYGMIHPEFFITPDGRINFGEVAARVPGGHIFELIQSAHGFDPFAGFVLCSDPTTTEEELARFFPDPADHDGYAGCLMVYPKQKIVTRVSLPDTLLEEPYYEKHNLFQPVNVKVAERAGYGDHYGTIFFKGSDAAEMTRLLQQYEQESFYTSDAPKTRAE